MTNLPRLLTLFSLLLAAGCQQYRAPVSDLPSKPLPEPMVTRAVANLHSLQNGEAVGGIALDRDDLVVPLTKTLRNLPPNSTLYLTVRPRRGTTSEEVGPITDLRGTSDSGILATVEVDAHGNGTLTNKTTVIYFLYDNLIGHNLTLSDADGQLAAAGILGIAEEY